MARQHGGRREGGVEAVFGIGIDDPEAVGTDQPDPRLAADLEANWEVLAEPIQQVMRRHGVAGAYEKLKEMSRGKRLSRARLARFIRGLDIPAAAKKRLLALTPAAYIGLATQLAKRV